MFGDIINNTLNDVGAKLWATFIYYATFQYLSVDPFWGWLFTGLEIIAVVLVVCWFFSPWWDKLRPIGGVIVLGVVWGLYAYWRGEQEAREHDKKRKRR